MTTPVSTSPRQAALVTGASSGIGYELAKILAQNGYDLVLIARRRDALDALATDLSSRFNVTTHVMAKDLSSIDAPKEIADELRNRGIAVDVLVNNAGFGMQGQFAQADETTQLQIMQVNIIALTRLTRLLLPGMLQRGGGRILNVASTAAFLPGPLMVIYYASKAYVLSLSQALSEELRKKNVSVTALCPGATRTEFEARAGMHNSKLFSGPTMDAGSVALAGYRGMLRGKRVVIPGFRNRLLVFAARIAPMSFVLRVARKLNRV